MHPGEEELDEQREGELQHPGWEGAARQEQERAQREQWPSSVSHHPWASGGAERKGQPELRVGDKHFSSV